MNKHGNTFLYDESFVSLCDEAFTAGDSDIKVNFNMDVTTSLRLRAVSVALVGAIQNVPVKRPLRLLFDTGSDKTLVNYKALPKGASPSTGQGGRVTGVHGTAVLNQEVLITSLCLPEFSPTQKVPGPIRATMFKNDDSNYDLIIGMDLLQALGIDVMSSSKRVMWGDLTIPFRPSDYFVTHTFDASSISSEDNPDDEALAKEAGYKSKVLLHSKYEKVDPQEVARQQKHLNQQQQADLARLLSKHMKLFSGKLGTYPHKKIHLELKPNAVPYNCRPYPIPRSQRQVFKDELDRLCKVGVLSKCGPSEWLLPSFAIPKKDGRIRFITDFRELNKMIKRRVYNLPKIQDILTKRTGYQFFTKIDVSMHYYTFELDDASKELCTICTPFGNYRYNRLGMGIHQSPDIAQEVMEDLFRALEEVDVYIDDVGCFNNTWEQHIQSLSKVLTILEQNNFTVNPFKCEWAVQETDWLGYWLTPKGLKPWRKKVDAILAIQRPKTVKQLRSFLGAINFYRDMYPRRSHILAPLTKLSGMKGNIPWKQEQQSAFDTIKALLAQEAFLSYPDHNKPFHIYVDASDLQLGAAIFQEGKPIAYYSRKLNAAQKNYTTGEKELLSIVETLKEFHTMLYGCPEIHVYTDHRNNTFARLQTQRVMRWRLFLEDYGIQLHYIKGSTNHLADSLSRLPFDERQDPIAPSSTSQSFYSMAIDDSDLLDCFLHLPSSEGVPFVLDYRTIRNAQTGDARLQALRNNQPNAFVQQMLAPDVSVYCYIPGPNAPWKIYIPTTLLRDAVRWYHLSLGHIGQNRLFDTMNQHLYHPDMRTVVEDIVTKCDACQRRKAVLRGHGENAPREALTHPWREVAVDLIGPWELTIDGREITFQALTIIDTVTNLTEIIRVDNKTAAHVALQFENSWLSRYPRPMRCIHDQGGEFTGYAFQSMLNRHNIEASPISSKNPRANSICERMHQAVGNSLRAMATLNPPGGINNANTLVDTALANCMYATRAAIHGTLQGSPGSLVFNRDMILDIPMIADWTLIQQRRQQLVDRRLIDANRKRFSYDYQVGQQVLKLHHKPNKLQDRGHGPYPITAVHTNGTVTIQLTPHTIERISIRRIKPYRT